MSRYDVVVIGGGQAGLAIGHHLRSRGLRFTILEAASEPAAAWRSRWDSLRLFTPARYDGLPGLPFPGDPDRYPGRDEVVDYLTDYARRFALPVELGARVTAVRTAGAGYRVEVGDRSLDADQVVIATGPFQAPRVPAFASALGVPHVHSASYRSPDDLPRGSVLVVGGGNTGFQIAAELSATHEVHLSIGSRQMPLPQRVAGRDLFAVLDATGLIGKTIDSRIGRRMRERDPVLVGSSPRRMRRLGVAIHGRTLDGAGTTVRVEDGELDVDGVVWATGFDADHSWIDAPVFDELGRPVHGRGVTAARGLYFLGLPWMHTRGSALLGWVGHDAEYLAGRIAGVTPP